jgi:hypothetical protein
MAKKDHKDLISLRIELTHLLNEFDNQSLSDNTRVKVLVLVNVFKQLREIGKSLLIPQVKSSARDRILQYFKQYPETILSGDEFLVISGIQEYARRIRELKVQFGWSIISGNSAREIINDGTDPETARLLHQMGPDDYMLLSIDQDREAALRWNTANSLRKQKIGAREKLLAYFRQNIGQKITSDELRYVSNDKSEWARRIRELRTEYGWPIVTKSSGRIDLAVGIYILEEDRQSPEHDRKIADNSRIEVLRRDKYSCTQCSWNQSEWNRASPRHLELHHIKHHSKGGDNSIDNLITVCTVCHDHIHRIEK